ncbi:MAG: Conserved protein, DUF885 [uncultured Propionibacteriaceae bacterium]|uniref:Conserved protein, DUF885 n=1 Tax=uncultured Propionibacteriaceae bacterium TaxID=257457 RepID=A0A6J4PME0_9ACTN|nr:MAG: Conserved protein, DUF885 [uncultured Propionibacteriaceae bacterium]
MTDQAPPTSGTVRQVRAVDAIADRYVEECTSRYPELATQLGAPGSDHRWSDYSLDGHADRMAHVRQTVADLHRATPIDEREQIAKDAMLERLGLQDELYQAHISTSRVSVIAGAAQEIRGVFDLMPVDSEDAWRNIAARLRTVGAPLGQTRDTLRSEAAEGNISALRQVLGTVEQIRSWTGEVGTDDFFAGLSARVPTEMSEAVRSDVAAAADVAREEFAAFGRWLAHDLAPLAPTLDAVGEQRYALDSREFLGAIIDLEETYLWGWEELRLIQDAQRQIARQLVGSDDIDEACAALDADPARQIHGATRFRDWMQQLADQAVSDLAGTHFDIPDEIKTIECCLAPTHDGSIYYTGPTEDFSRPGRMWWAVPEGIEDFSTWKEVTTVYHEGVPGHHLQVAQNAYRKDRLNRWQRQLCFVSGHGEGWALYAERLMNDLGYLNDPGDKMGMLDAHAFRATRVIIDIGMHLQLEIPADNPWRFRPGERWTPAAGFEFLTANCFLDEATLRFELDRYLGWPGQAPSYKVGERIWLEARDEARARKGADFDLRQFHADALDLGSLGLDPLRRALSRI